MRRGLHGHILWAGVFREFGLLALTVLISTLSIGIVMVRSSLPETTSAM